MRANSINSSPERLESLANSPRKETIKQPKLEQINETDSFCTEQSFDATASSNNPFRTPDLKQRGFKLMKIQEKPQKNSNTQLDKKENIEVLNEDHAKSIRNLIDQAKEDARKDCRKH